jgi:hypothetical protein
MWDRGGAAHLSVPCINSGYIALLRRDRLVLVLLVSVGTEWRSSSRDPDFEASIHLIHREKRLVARSGGEDTFDRAERTPSRSRRFYSRAKWAEEEEEERRGGRR